MDRTPFQLSFTKDRIPRWLCPSCANGHLELQPASFVRAETAQSVKEHDHEAWEPQWIRTRFACMFSCSNTECNEPVTCTGEGSADAIEYEDAELGWVQAASDRFDAKYFDPPLMLMDIPTRCPSNATEHLVASFKLCFADPGASLNSLRCALEAVLTGVGVKRFSFTGKKRHEIGLHQRIKLLNPKFKEQVDLLLAVKWLGNSGSHDGQEPNVADVMVTYDILEHALSEMFDSKTKRLKAVAKKVIAKKGRIKRNFGKALA